MSTLPSGVSNTGSLDGSTATYGAVTNLGTVGVTDRTILYLDGSIINKGQIKLNSTSTGSSAYTYVQLTGNVTLSGGGTVVMSNNINAANQYGNVIQDYNNRNVVLDNVDNKITGAGQLGAAFLTFINEAGGVVNANAAAGASSGQLVINTQNSAPVINKGLLEATSSGGLLITNTQVVNSGTGSIQALVAGSHVDLYGATISGGTLRTSAGGVGVINAYSSTGVIGQLDGASAGQVTNAGTLIVQDNQTFDLAGSINNKGQIKIGQISASGNTALRVATQFVTLTGKGTLVMTNNAGNVIEGNFVDSHYTLSNVDNTISGAGTIGNNMQVSNSGKIIANQSLALQIGSSSGHITNNASGLMQATGGGGLSITSGIFENDGTLESDDGSAVTIGAGVYTNNDQAGELFRGTWNVVATTHGSTMSLNGNTGTGGPVVTDSATINLNGPGTVFQAFNGSAFVPLEMSLTTISSVGALNILGSRNYTTTNTLSDSGKISLGGGTLNANSIVVNTGGLLSGSGTVATSVANSGQVEANGGTLTITGNVSGTGTLQSDTGATLLLNGTSNASGNVVDNGTVTVSAGHSLTASGNLTGTGAMQVNAAGVLNLNGAANSIGTVLDNGTVNVGASDSLTVTGSIDTGTTGLFVLTNASLMEVAAATGNNDQISFAGASGDTLKVDAVASFGTGVGGSSYKGPLLKGFTNTIDKVDLKNLAFAGAAINSYTAGTGFLQLHSGSTLATLHFNNADLGTGIFHIANDGSGGTMVTHF